MKALGLSPGDPRLDAINEIQWSWCIAQVTEDLVNKFQQRDHELLLLVGASNPELALKLHERMISGDVGQRVSDEMTRRIAEMDGGDGTAGTDEESMSIIIKHREHHALDPIPSEQELIGGDFVEDPDA